ncbi:MAG: acylneuraminate cytidylyltransferase family protein [bacterium]|nr:acylneuraminate cytidylyltransferase family protein [bacterium]
MNILGFIPARAGSKRLPDKNIRVLGDKPLITYTIAASLAARDITRTIVSTDSRDIASISLSSGAEVPFMRPPELAQSNSTEMEFFLHALEWLKKNESYVPDLIVLLYPTSPFRKAESIDRAIRLMLQHPEADSLRSIRMCSEHPYKMWQIDERGYLRPFVKTGDTCTQTLSTQLFPMVYIQNASIYITKPSTILNKQSPIGDIVIPFIMDDIESTDINTLFDFKCAEMILNENKKASS